jgi:Terminase-like family.
MKQSVALNDRYEILTPNGWEDFRGVIRNEVPRPGVEIRTATRTIRATHDHRFFIDGEEVRAAELFVGQLIDTVSGKEEIVSITNISLDETFDIIETASHSVYTSGIVTHQCDELSFVSPSIQKDFWTSVQPVLSTGGSCIVTSTPKSDVDQFAKIWKDANDKTDEYGNPTGSKVGKNGFYPFKAPWWLHPERDEEWAKPFRASLGEALFRQEFCCEFITDDQTLINPMLLANMKAKEPEFYTGTVRWFKEPEPNKVYLVALDPSLGAGGDPAAIEVFELPGMTQVAEWQHNLTPTRGQVKVLLQILLFIDDALRNHPDQSGEPEIYWTVENNTLGDGVLQIIEDTGEDKFPGMLISERKKKGQTRRFRKGLNTDHRKKLAACAKFKSLVETQRMVLNSLTLINQLKVFVGTEGGTKFAAKPGEHDDLVMATLLCVRMLDTVIAWGVNVGNVSETISDEELMEEQEPMPVIV